MSNWGKGSENNNIGWGQAAHTATNDWGKSQKTSWAGDTDIVGDPALGISYSASAFCEDASNPTPTVSGNEGSGTFSSTTGLVFVSTSTGEVNISSSTAGATYLITYTDTNAATATFSLTINNLDSAAFAYSASSYEPTDADPTPTITGLTGGTFSSTSGLVFVDSGTNTGSSTGQIDLSATTIASYTITYNTTSSGSSVCPNTSTQSVEVAVAGIANNYSISFDGSDDYLDTNFVPADNLTTNCSISAWVNMPAINNGVNSSILGTYDFGGGGVARSRFFLRIYRTGGVYYYMIGLGTVQDLTVAISNFSVNTWVHLAVTYDGTDIKLYSNGTLDGTLNSGSIGSYPPVTSGFNGISYIGASHRSSGANTEAHIAGNLDEIAIWNTALTSTQVSEIYSATSAGLTKDLSTIEPSNLKYFNRMGD